MANMLASLPLLKGWEFAGSKHKNIKVTEKKKDLVDVQEKGYLNWAICNTNDADAELAFEADGKLLSETLVTAKDLVALGLTSPNPLGLFCAVFDVINEKFIIAFVPASPWPYTQTLKITLRPTEKKPILVLHGFECKTIKIVDEALFKQGLKDLSSSK